MDKLNRIPKKENSNLPARKRENEGREKMNMRMQQEQIRGKILLEKREKNQN